MSVKSNLAFLLYLTRSPTPSQETFQFEFETLFSNHSSTKSMVGPYFDLSMSFPFFFLDMRLSYRTHLSQSGQFTPQLSFSPLLSDLPHRPLFISTIDLPRPLNSSRIIGPSLRNSYCCLRPLYWQRLSFLAGSTS